MKQHPKAKAAGITSGEWEYGNGGIWSENNGEDNSPTEVTYPLSKQDGVLMCKAGNTMNAYGHTPSEMVAIIRELVKERDQYRTAIETCLNRANGRQWEWGSRAENAFEFLESAMEITPTKTEDFR